LIIYNQYVHTPATQGHDDFVEPRTIPTSPPSKSGLIWARFCMLKTNQVEPNELAKFAWRGYLDA